MGRRQLLAMGGVMSILKLTQFWNSQSTDGEESKARTSATSSDKNARTNSNLLSRIRKPFQSQSASIEEVVEKGKTGTPKKEEEFSGAATKDLLAPMRMRGQSTDELEKDTAKFRKASSSVTGSTPSSILRTMQSKEKPVGVQSKSKSSPALAKRSSYRAEESPARTIKSETNRAQTNDSQKPQGDLTQQGSLVLDRKNRFEKVVKESTKGSGERKNTLEAKNLIAGAGRDSVQAIIALYTTSKPTPAYSVTSVLTSKAPSDDELSDEECLKEEPRISVPQKNEVQVANKKEHKVAMVAKEILSSEKVYVGILRLLVDFKRFVEKKKVETSLDGW